MKSCLVLALAIAAAACGGGDDDVFEDCGFASDRYLPYEVGYTWEYRVTDLGSGDVTTKSQVVDSSFNHPDDGEPVFLQLTQKDGGRTENWLRLENDSLYRLQQQDFNSLGDLLRTNEYDPGRIRLDESSERIADGATFTENFTDIEYDALGVEVSQIATTDAWEVLGVDVPCESPLGTFTCLHIRRTRTQGGIAVKEFMFARGIGKVREDGGQIEQLTGCYVAE